MSHHALGRRSRLVAGVAIASAVMIAVAGCGSSGSSSSSSPAAEAASSAPESASVPASEAASSAASESPSPAEPSGPIIVGVDATYPPYEFKDGDKYVGLEVDLLNAAAAQIGRPVEYQDVKWDVAEGAVQAGRFDLMMIGATDNDERRAAFYMVSPIESGRGLIVPAGNPDNLSNGASLCGKKISTFDNEALSGQLEKLSKDNCGDNPIKIIALKDGNAPYAAVQSGRAQAFFGHYLTSVVTAKEMGDYEVIPVPDVEPARTGLGIAKTNEPLAQAIACGMQAAMDAGEGDKIAAKYNVDPSVILKTIEINGGEVPLQCS